MIKYFSLIEFEEVNVLPNIKSAKKRVKIAKARTLRNKSIKSEVKTWIKKFDTAIANGDLENARVLYPQVVKKIDMAAAKGIFHKNAAARRKSSLAIKLNKAQAQ